jgi:uroporphyrinogen-III synthase
MPGFEILIFTSPSNVESFFGQYKTAPIQKIIAMGEATGNALRKYGVTRYFLPDSFDDTGLVRAVFNCTSET